MEKNIDMTGVVDKYEKSIRENSSVNWFGNYKKYGQYCIKHRCEHTNMAVVMAGPTLDENLEILRNVKNCFVIVADVVATKLDALGINYDAVCAMDMVTMNETLWPPRNKKAFVITHVAYDTSNLSKIDNPKIIFSLKSEQWTDPQCIRSNAIFKPYYDFGTQVSLGNVAMSAFQFAHDMGAERIFLFGCDWSFPNKRYYAEGIMQKIFLDEMKAGVDKPDFVVKKDNGDTILTNWAYKLFYELFANWTMLHGRSDTMYNCSHGGLLDHTRGINQDGTGEILKL